MCYEEVNQSESNRELYTPQPVQARVVERHLDGASNRQIAKEEGLDRETVSRILSQRELVEMRAAQQSQLQRLVSKALKVYEELLDSPDARLAAATATKILEGTGVMDGRGLQLAIDDSTAEPRKTTIKVVYVKTPGRAGKPVIPTTSGEIIDMPALKLDASAQGEPNA
jgi:transposase